ncbi:MAG TPA: hypothetical protein VFY10_05220 [Dehalococcoidia bacterium]|nr:hypothetical protein [Dehalococcoidia bacterium]
MSFLSVDWEGIEGGLTATGLIDAFVFTRRDLVAANCRLPAERRDRPFGRCLGPKDLLAHLAVWDGTNFDAIRDVLASRRPLVLRPL